MWILLDKAESGYFKLNTRNKRAAFVIICITLTQHTHMMAHEIPPSKRLLLSLFDCILLSGAGSDDSLGVWPPNTGKLVARSRTAD